MISTLWFSETLKQKGLAILYKRISDSDFILLCMFSYLWYSIAINCTISNNAKLSRNISAIGSREKTSVGDRVPLGNIFGIFMEIESPIVSRKKVATSQSALQKKKANVTYMKGNSKTAWRPKCTVPEHIDKTTYKVIFAYWQAYLISKFSQIISYFFLLFFILFKRF